MIHNSTNQSLKLSSAEQHHTLTFEIYLPNNSFLDMDSLLIRNAKHSLVSNVYQQVTIF